jgi:phosphatidylserine/phosphatidylglycerophosphate/cardiolipin synthase-like enzyme
MSWKTKFLVCLLGFLVIFGSGAGLGYHYAKSNPTVRTIFTPYDDGIGNYLAALDTAHHDVYVAGYAFTDMRIVDKLVDLAKNRKVKLHLVLDQSQTRSRTADSERKAIEALRAVGAEVIIGTSEMHHEIMHNKFTVIDGHLVEDGSWNYSKSANFQANVLNFIDDRDRAGKFIATWERMAKFMRTQDQALKVDEDKQQDTAQPPAVSDDQPAKKPRPRKR